MTKHTFLIADDFQQKRLDQAIALLLPDYSRAQIQAWIKSGHVLVNNEPAKANLKLKGGEQVDVDVQARAEEAWMAQDIPINIVHEDDDIIVVNKPVGLIVHPGSGVVDGTLLNALLHHAPVLKTMPRAGIIHRLDKNTSGLLVIAKNEAAYQNLTKQLKKRTITREYQAIVYGEMISGGTVNAPIARHAVDRKRMAIVEDGRESVTHYRVKEKFRSHTLVQLKLETGRTHQIRVHMQHIRYPLVGDSTYGGRTRLSKGMPDSLIELIRHFKRQALHAYALGFEHPTTKEPVQYHAELPEDMQILIKALRAFSHEND